jgi:GNAT superfamily N-acetyltransferase
LRRLVRRQSFRELHSVSAEWIERHFELLEANSPWLDRTGTDLWDYCQGFARPPGLDPGSRVSAQCTRAMTVVYGFDGPLHAKLDLLGEALFAAGWGKIKNVRRDGRPVEQLWVALNGEEILERRDRDFRSRGINPQWRSVTELERPAFESFLVVDQQEWRLSELRRPAWPWWGALVDTHAVRAAFDAQIRRRTGADEPGAVVEADAGVLRWLAPGTQSSCVTWSELTRDSADAVIAAQVRYFAARGTPVEWKLYDYDQPADLAQRLLAAGFVADDEELMLVAETAAIACDVKLPDGVWLDLVTDDAGVEAMMAVHDLAFARHPSPELGERLAAQLREAPELIQMVVAMAGDEPVSAARVEFTPGTDFAGLWGGGTVPAWRGRGIFRALVAYRAGLAAARGYRYLQVDALPASRPILQRLGFERVAATTPYVWRPPGQ